MSTLKWRFGVLVAGLLSVWVAIGSPLGNRDHEMLSMHMVQHLLLMAVGAPLILLGVPIGSLKQLHPAVGWLAGTAAVIGWHIPAAFELGMRSHWWHLTQQATFLAAGILFWWPIIERRPGPSNQSRWFVPLYLFLATLPCDALAAFLTFGDRVVYESYGRRAGHGFSPLRDQETAGALMWVCVTFVYLVPAVVATIRLLSPPSASEDVDWKSLASSRNK